MHTGCLCHQKMGVAYKSTQLIRPCEYPGDLFILIEVRVSYRIFGLGGGESLGASTKRGNVKGLGQPPSPAPQKNSEDLASLESLEMKLVDFDEVLDVFREKNRHISR